MKRLATAVALLSLPALCLEAAPLPFAKDKKVKEPQSLKEVVFDGTYDLYWGGAVYDMSLDKKGNYKAVSSSGTVWVGGYSVVGNTFHLNETTTPENPDSWSHYEIPMCHKKLEGKIGGDGIQVKIRKVEPLKPREFKRNPVE